MANKPKKSNAMMLKIIGLLILFMTSIVLIMLESNFHLVFSFLTGVCAELVYLNYQKQKKIEAAQKLELQEFIYALQRFNKMFELIKDEIKQFELFILYYSGQIIQIQQAICKLFPEEKNIDDNVITEKKITPADEWLELLEVHKAGLSEYPPTTKVSNFFTTKSINKYCNLLEEHHHHLRFFSEHMVNKGEECLRYYEKLFFNLRH